MPDEFGILRTELSNIKEKVSDIDKKLESIKISSRLAVLEDRQNTVFRMLHAGFGFIGTILCGLILWLFTSKT